MTFAFFGRHSWYTFVASKAMPFSVGSSKGNYNYVVLICNSMICCSIWINNARSAGVKSVIVLSCALHYYNFPTCITNAINSKYYSQPYYYITKKLASSICNIGTRNLPNAYVCVKPKV